jgi:ketosteroid isomerase-like protein
MKPILGIALLTVVALMLPGIKRQATAQDSKLEQELLTRYREWSDAVAKGTAAARFERNAAEDYTFVDAQTGGLHDKKGTLELLKAFDAQSWDIDDVKVRIYGDTAVVTSRWTLKGKLKGEDISGEYRATATWVKRSGNWQEVASQATRIISP